MIREFFYFLRFPILVFIFSNILDKVGLYNLYPWIDIPMHFFGGMAIAYMFVLIFNFLKEKKLLKINSKLIYLILILSSVILIAVLWEFYEYLMNYFFNLNIVQTLEDTILDLLMGLFGGLVVGLIWKN